MCIDVWNDYCDCQRNVIAGGDLLTFDDWIEDCMYDRCGLTKSDLSSYSYGNALLNGIFTQPIGICEALCKGDPTSVDELRTMQFHFKEFHQ